MQLTEDFDAFVAIVEAGSISEAARALDVPRASLSRQLSRLESRLGVRLLNRTTRALVPTLPGATLYQRARRLLDGAEAAVEAVQRMDDVPRGLLRISMAPPHSSTVGVLIGEFLLANPEVTVELKASSRHVDLVAEPIDIAIRAGIIRDGSLIVRPLFRSEMVGVASPAYLQRHGALEVPEDLEGHVCLRGYMQGSRPATAWPLIDGGKVRVGGRFVSDDIVALHGAAIAGLGISLQPKEVVAQDLAEGRLQTVLDGVLGVQVSLSLVWLEREFIEPKVRAFVDAAVQWAEDGRLAPTRCPETSSNHA